jgi:ADP-glucose pyrophosphorylase
MVHPLAQIAGSAQLQSAFIGRDARLDDSTVVQESVVVGGAVLRQGAQVFRSVVMGSVEVGRQERVVDEIRVAPLPGKCPRS